MSKELVNQQTFHFWIPTSSACVMIFDSKVIECNFETLRQHLLLRAHIIYIKSLHTLTGAWVSLEGRPSNVLDMILAISPGQMVSWTPYIV